MAAIDLRVGPVRGAAMTLLAYGVKAGSAIPPSIVGVGGRSVQSLAVGDLRVLYSAVGTVPMPPDPETAVAYGRVLDVVHAAETVVPFRYGAIADDTQQLAALVRPQANWFRETLQRLDGLTEMTLRISLDSADACVAKSRSSVATPRVESQPDATNPAHPESGVDYLRRRKALFVAKDAGPAKLAPALEQLRAAVPGICEMKAERVTHPELGIAAHVLIPRRIAADLQAVIAAHPILATHRCVVTGPWPPFTFAGSPLSKPV